MTAPITAVAGIRTRPEPEFHELMSEQLARAPWLLLSVALHAAVIALLFLIPAEAPAAPTAAAVVLAPEPEAPMVEPEPPRVEPEVEPRDPERLIELAEPEPLAPTEARTESIEFVETAEPAAFTPAAALAVGLGASPPAGYGGRRPGGRPRGGKGWHEHQERALRWLAAHQDADGRWDCDGFMKHDAQGPPCDGVGDALHDVGVTGLALLAFLGDGNTLREGPYRDIVRRAVNWLREQQDADTGRIGGAGSHHFIYDHTIAALALCEAQYLSRYRVLRPTVERAVGYLQAHRNPYGVWRYQPSSGDQDLSVTGWACLVLASAEQSGIPVDRRSFGLIDAYIDEMTDAQGRSGYSQRGGLSSRHAGRHEQRFPAERNECMTAVALLCRALRPGATLDATMRRQADLIARRPPRWEDDGSTSSIDFYAWYYATYAMFQIGGATWNAWSRALGDAVIEHQRSDGNFAGSWDPIDAWGEEGGRVYATAILALTLQAYYRYARVIGGR